MGVESFGRHRPNDTITELTRDDGAYARDRAYDYCQVQKYWH